MLLRDAENDQKTVIIAVKGLSSSHKHYRAGEREDLERFQLLRYDINIAYSYNALYVVCGCEP